MVLWIPLILGGSVLLLGPFKFVLIALQYYSRACDKCLDAFSEED